MTNKAWIATGIIVLVLLIGGVVWWQHSANLANTPTATSTPIDNTNPTGGNSTLQNITFAGGEISLAYPTDVYGLATSPAQILVHSNIPPCDTNFDYCLYRTGSTYSGTNFESAGIRIKKRADLTTEQFCLKTPPAGYGSATDPAASNSADLYSTSVFNVQGAAAGNYAQGLLYRLFVRGSSSCYEFETRIGSSQFANYPSGTIKEFTALDRQTVQDSLRTVIDSVNLTASNTEVTFPLASQ